MRVIEHLQDQSNQRTNEVINGNTLDRIKKKSTTEVVLSKLTNLTFK